MNISDKFKNSWGNIWKIVLLLMAISLFSDFIKSPSLLITIVLIILFYYLFFRKGLFSKKNKPMSEEIPKIVNVGKKASLVVWTIVILILVVILIANSLVIIKAGETGVYHLFGRVKDDELHSGLHLINPLANVTPMSIRTESYTMSIIHNEGQRTGPDEITALTKEGLEVALDITVLYHLMEQNASDVYKNVGEDYEEKIIRPEIRSVIREVIAQYEAKDIYSEKRSEAAAGILEKLIINIEPRGIDVEDVLLRNVVLPDTLSISIEEKLSAEQEAQKYDFILQSEKKEAERKRIEAEGQRDAQKIINESLTPTYLNYLYIQQLKDRPGTVYVPISSENGLPLFKNIP